MKKLLENATVKVSLLERNWNKKISSAVATQLRNAIDEDNYTELKEALKAIYKEIHALVPELFDADELEEKLDDLELLSMDASEYEYDDYDDEDRSPEEMLEDEWNYVLDDMWEMCNAFNIWVPVLGECVNADKCNKGKKDVLNENTTDEYEEFQRILWGSKRYEFQGSKLILTNYRTGHEIILDLAEINEEMFEALHVGSDSDEVDEEDF